ncbi:MAG: biotin--[acetyl-CoA-carboxylase] ligase [Actinomycetota bacterium]|nr:biotin--[acetyl-CoA-carboxylase] ligase [Actinomycetota bacterium]
MVQGLTCEIVERLKSPLARTVELREELGSTQGRARALAHGGASHGTLVISRVQTGGRGRLGRSWGSPLGGLWMSLVLRPGFDAGLAPRITPSAAVAVAKALRELGIEARIKWPNDLLVAGRKICGILAEASAAPIASKSIRPDDRVRRLDFVVLGIGMNANLDPQDLGVPDREVTTLRSELGHDVDLGELLKTLLTNLETELNKIEDFESVLGDWRALDCTLGQRVRVQRFGETLEGTAKNLSPEGALILETKDRTIELFEGEIEHLRM